MLKQIVDSLSLDMDYPERSRKIDVYTRILNGELYDKLPYSFTQEYDGTGKYIPLCRRAPSVKNSLCKVVVDESVSLLFGSDHFPDINADDETTTETIKDIVNYIALRQHMIEAALTGSVGSVAVFLRVIDGEVSLEVKGTQYLTPYFEPTNPKKLIRLVERYKVTGEELNAAGYEVERKSSYWFMRIWDEENEIVYKPYRHNDTPEIDKDASVMHGLGFVPVVWIKNLPKPGCRGNAEIDGACTFSGAIDNAIEIDYLLSQGGRGLKYSSDPLVVFRLEDEMTLTNNAIMVAGSVSGASGAKKIIKSSSNSFVLGQGDDAKLLEINGRAIEAIINHVRYLRELALENIHGNRSHADKVNATQSGKAMERLNQSLIWLADILRIYYGNNGIVPIVKMILEASRKVNIVINGNPLGAIKETHLTLNWPAWYPTSTDDKKRVAETLKILTDSKIMSKETATKFVSEEYNISDEQEEISKIQADQAAIDEQQPQVKEMINL